MIIHILQLSNLEGIRIKNKQEISPRFDSQNFFFLFDIKNTLNIGGENLSI